MGFVSNAWTVRAFHVLHVTVCSGPFFWHLMENLWRKPAPPSPPWPRRTYLPDHLRAPQVGAATPTQGASGFNAPASVHTCFVFGAEWFSCQPSAGAKAKDAGKIGGRCEPRPAGMDTQVPQSWHEGISRPWRMQVERFSVQGAWSVQKTSTEYPWVSCSGERVPTVFL